MWCIDAQAKLATCHGDSFDFYDVTDRLLINEVMQLLTRSWIAIFKNIYALIFSTYEKLGSDSKCTLE